MKINKDKWIKVEYGDYVSHIETNEYNEDKRKDARYVSVEHLETGKLIISTWFNEEMPTFFRTFKKGQILFGKRRAYQRKVVIANFDGICSPHIWALEAKNGLLQNTLPFIMLTDSFYNYVNANSAGTMSVYLKWPQLSKYIFKLPPIDEQRYIVDIFQTLEQSINQVEEQEKTIKSLWLRLIDEFVSDTPSFGDFLYNQKLKTVRFGEVTSKLLRRIDPVKYGIERIVAGENLESEDFKIRSYGLVGKDFLGPAFHVLFEPGDILYGSRRTYLKKVSMPDFEGVCANTTFVIRAKEDVLLQNLLKHIMLSNKFTQYSIGVSKGSTNPYINWKDLDNFSFQLPDITTQKKIADLLDDIIELLEQLKQQKADLKTLKQKLLNEILG